MEDKDYQQLPNGTDEQANMSVLEMQNSNKNIGKVLYLGFAFVTLFSAFNAAQSLVSEIYEQLGYDQLGRYSLIALYATFLGTNLLAPNIIQGWSYRKGMFVGSLGYVICLFSGLVTTSCSIDSSYSWCQGTVIIYGFNLFGSICCGLGAPVLWLSNAKYITVISNINNRGKFFGVFWTIMNFNFVIGNIIAVWVIKSFSQFAFYLVVTAMAAVSSFLLLLAPPADKPDADQQPKKISERVQAMKNFVKNRTFQNIIPYFLYTGLIVAVYNTFETQIIVSTIPNDSKEDKNVKSGIIFIIQGVVAAATSLIIGKVADVVKNRTLLYNASNLMAVLAIVWSILTFFQESFDQAYVMAIFWGLTSSATLTLGPVIISKDYDGAIEGFAVQQFLMEIGVIFGIILTIVFADRIGTTIIIIYVLLFITQTITRAYESKKLA